MKKQRLKAGLLSVVMIANTLTGFSIVNVKADDSHGKNVIASESANALNYIVSEQNERGDWSKNYNRLDTYESMNVLQKYDENEDWSNSYSKALDYVRDIDETNTDYLSRKLMITELADESNIEKLIANQNINGGYGLNKNYESDVLDTILAVNALTNYISNVDASNTYVIQSEINAVNYLLSKQNADGSLSYENVEEGSVLLTSEMVSAIYDYKKVLSKNNIFENENVYNLYENQISNSIILSKGFLEENTIEASEEIQSKIEAIKKFRALLKINGLSDIDEMEEEILSLQNEDGSVGEDIYATALFVEVLEEKESLPDAEISDIKITKDDIETSEFNVNENLSYEVLYTSDDNTSLKVEILDENNQVIFDNNTVNGSFLIGDTKAGIYKIKATVTDNEYGYVLSSYEEDFTVLENITCEEAEAFLTNNATMIGQNVNVTQKLSFTVKTNTEKNIVIKSNVISNDTIILENEYNIDLNCESKSVNMDSITFAPDTSSACRYEVNVKVLCDDNVLFEKTNIYTVNDRLPKTDLLFSIEKDRDLLYPTNDRLDLNFTLKGVQNGVIDSINFDEELIDSDSDTDLFNDEIIEEDGSGLDDSDNSGEFVYSSNLLKNTYIAFSMMNSNYSVGTLEGDPNSLNDNNKKLVYGHPGGGTSYTTLNIDGNLYKYSCGSTTCDLENGSLKTEGTRNNILVTQTGTIVTNPITGRKDIVRLKYHVKNTDEVSHDVGLRIMIDTMLGNNDSAPFRVPGYGGVTRDLEIAGDNIPQYYQVFDNLNNPSVVAQGIFYMNNELKPDKVQFVNWGRASNNLWEPGIAGNIGDSAVNSFWNPSVLMPGEEREYVTYYGCGEISSNVEGNLVTGLTGVSRLDTTDTGYNPNPFTVTAYAYNIGMSTLENVTAKIVLPEGLHLNDGEIEVKELGNIVSGSDTQTSWDVVADFSDYDKTLTYSVEYYVNGEYVKTVNRQIFIPQFLNNIAAKDVVLKTDINTPKFVIKTDDFNIAPSELTQNEDGTSKVEWNFDTILIDEIKNINVSINSDNLVPGENVLVCKNTILEFTDRDGNRQVKRIENMNIPVATYSLKTILNTDKDEYSTNEDVNITLNTFNPKDYNVTLNGTFKLYDENDVFIKDIESMADISWNPLEEKDINTSFDTKDLYAGKYIIKSEWCDENNVISSAKKVITVLKDGKLCNEVNTDKSRYSQKEKITITTKVKNTSTNYNEENVRLITQIVNEDYEVVYENEKELGNILNNDINTSTEYFDNLNLSVGTYTVISKVISNDEIVSVDTKDFDIISAREDLSNIIGEINLSEKTISPVDTLNITANIKNDSNESLNELLSYITVTRLSDKKVIRRYDFSSDLEAGKDETNEVSFAEESLEKGDYLVSYYGIMESGEIKILATDSFKVEYIEDPFIEDNDLWNYMGSAYRSEEGYAVLTHNINHQAGAMWLKKGIDKPFVVNFRYLEGGGNSADGFVFMFAKNPNELGNEGRELGFKEGNGYGVEFDSFYNLFHTEHAGINSKHIALIKDKLSGSDAGKVITPLSINLEDKFASKLGDNAWHDVEIYVDYDGVMVYVDGERAIEYKGEINFEYDGFGFSAATGTSNDNHYIDDVVIRENTRIKKQVSDSRTYLGSAHEDENGYIVLTENETWQSGAMWIDDAVSAPFDASFKYMSNGEGNIADGFTFMFNKKGDEIGDNGAFLGFKNGNGYGVEFDSFFNTTQSEHNANGLKHIALSKDYLATNNKNEVVNSLAINTDSNVTSKINDGNWHDVVVKVRKDGVRVFLDDDLVLEYNGTIDETYSSIGFAASTGGYSQSNYIKDILINEEFTKEEVNIVDDFSADSGEWNLMGSATLSSEGYLSINPSYTWQTGVAWLNRDIATEFETTFDYTIIGEDGNADGFSYMFFKNKDELGFNGKNLGFSDGNGYAVEFDTYYNGLFDEKIGDNKMHIALVKNSTAGNISEVLAYNNDDEVISKLTDKESHNVNIKVCKDSVVVLLDGEEILRYEGTLDTTYRYSGFSGATGGICEEHIIDNFVCKYEKF